MIIKEIENILDERIRPQLALHCGNLSIVSYKDSILTVRLLGQCCHCPSAAVTVSEFVEEEIKAAVPQVSRVVLDSSVSEELVMFAKKLLRHE